jgi:hypothetical protein
MRYSNGLIAGLLASCLMGAMSCSGDGTDPAALNAHLPRFPDSPVGAAGSGGAGAGGSAVGGAGPGSATAGASGAAGVAGSMNNGGGGASPEAPPNDPPPEEPPLPIPTDVGFSDVLAILSGSCTPCHATAGSQLPAFAQDDAAAAYDVTQEPSNFADQLYSDRIVERSVVDRTMPPACSGGDLGTGACVSERDAALLEAWIDQGAPP